MIMNFSINVACLAGGGPSEKRASGGRLQPLIGAGGQGKSAFQAVRPSNQNQNQNQGASGGMAFGTFYPYQFLNPQFPQPLYPLVAPQPGPGQPGPCAASAAAAAAAVSSGEVFARAINPRLAELEKSYANRRKREIIIDGSNVAITYAHHVAFYIPFSLPHLTLYPFACTP